MKIHPVNAEYFKTFPGAKMKVRVWKLNLFLTDTANSKEHDRNNRFTEISVISVVRTQNETSNQCQTNKHWENQHQILDILANCHIQDSNGELLGDFMVQNNVHHQDSDSSIESFESQTSFEPVSNWPGIHKFIGSEQLKTIIMDQTQRIDD